METDFRDRLQTTLTGAYRVERELGGGGMSDQDFVLEALKIDAGREIGRQHGSLFSYPLS